MESDRQLAHNAPFYGHVSGTLRTRQAYTGHHALTKLSILPLQSGNFLTFPWLFPRQCQSFVGVYRTWWWDQAVATPTPLSGLDSPSTHVFHRWLGETAILSPRSVRDFRKFRHVNILRVTGMRTSCVSCAVTRDGENPLTSLCTTEGVERSGQYFGALGVPKLMLSSNIGTCELVPHRSDAPHPMQRQ